MRLEDALLYLILDTPGQAPDDLDALCGDAIAGGVDVIQISKVGKQGIPMELAQRIHGVCRRDDALLLLGNDADLARELGADGVLLDSDTASIGQARAVLGMDAVVGLSTTTVDDAELGLEVGADYLVHWAGTGCASAFASLPGATGLPLFAAGISELEDARQVVATGVYRLCVQSSLLSETNVTDQAAEYSRLLGRCI